LRLRLVLAICGAAGVFPVTALELFAFHVPMQ